MFTLATTIRHRRGVMHSIRAAAALALVLLATHPRGWAARGAITAAVVLPHGDIAWWPQGADPPLNASQRQQAEALRSAAEAAGQLLAEQRPDLILLTTPHGLATSRHTALLLNPTAAGCLDPAAAWRAAQAGLCGSAGVDAAAPGAPCPCSNVTLDAALSLELLQRLEDRHVEGCELRVQLLSMPWPHLLGTCLDPAARAPPAAGASGAPLA